MNRNESASFGHDKNSSENPQEPWWREGVSVFGEVTGWIVVPLIAALYGGRALDAQQGTENLWFLVCTGSAFLISCIGIGRLGVRYIKKIEAEAEAKKEITNNESHVNDRQ